MNGRSPTISNMGDLDLDWSLSEALGGFFNGQCNALNLPEVGFIHDGGL